ncbi:MAG: helix-hairpin-helix domain-containing protein [Defluviitaleaceae bacterium]|nr:helix-hairpin-helix domain-containing protein [Defluviitaleaceae bacterium]
MKKFGRFLSVMLSLVFILGVLPAVASPFVELPTPEIARVTQVIDVNSIRVVDGSGQEALVRLIGVSPSGSRQGIDFLRREIGGRYVFLMADEEFNESLQPAGSGRWNYMYVFVETRFINAELVLSGYAMLNENHRHAELFDDIRGAAGVAQQVGLGLWANESRQPHIVRYMERININTATAAQIIAHTDAPAALAHQIVIFRASVPFQQISDLKFVTTMTRSFFEENSHRLGVSTNINTAIEEELITIFNLTQTRAIIASRQPQNQGLFTDVQELVSRGILTQAGLNQNQRFAFISVTDDYEIDFARPNFRANMNLASHAQLIRAGTGAANANTIITQRQLLPLRNLHDFTVGNVIHLADNLRPFTNINTAPRSELESIFGTSPITAPVINSTVDAILEHRELTPFANINELAPLLPAAVNFDVLAPFIYTHQPPMVELINISRATVAQMIDAGIPAPLATLIANNVGRINWLVPSNIPVGIRNQIHQLPAEVQARLSVRTNINTASAAELRTLHPLMEDGIVSWIISYRNAQIFGTQAELGALFYTLNQTALYNQISRFIIFR